MLVSRLTWLITLAASSGLRTQAATVQWGNTTMTGRDIPTLQQEFFGGIPFAEPPVGQLRLQPPVAKLSLGEATFNATQYGPGCVQPISSTSSLASYSEDCLTINILRPAGTLPSAQLPVMAWVYGGGFVSGETNIYNASAIVGQSVLRGTPVIYVNFNYRLGPLGFPQGQEADEKHVLNLGLLDQATALQWVQTNIGAFGGDPSKVTVFGESAGAISIAIHMLRPSFEKLARAVILESGSAASTVVNFAAARQGAWDTFVKALPACESTVGTHLTIDCLRNASLDVSTLTRAIGVAVTSSADQSPFAPALDGDVYPALPSIILPSGNYAKLPFIAGTNLDEGTGFVGDPASIAGSDYAAMLLVGSLSPSLIPGAVGASLLNATTEVLLKLYPDVPALGSPYNTGNETFGFNSNYKRVVALAGDLAFDSQRRTLQQITSSQGITSYGYLFTDPQPQLPAYLGVAHGVEIPYVYGSCSSFSPPSQALCLNIINYWVSFATSLDPNDGKGAPRPQWPQYMDNSQVLLELNGNATQAIPDTYRKKQIDFINANSIVYHHRRSSPFRSSMP